MTAAEAARGAFHDRSSAEDFLRALGGKDGTRLPIAEAALAFALRDGPPTGLAPYRAHLGALAQDVGALAANAADLEARISALNEALFRRAGYAGDTETYDDLQNANLIRVIDRRKGLPVALGIIAIHVARAQGWEMSGLALPGHFLVGLEHGRARAILDPFNGGRIRNASELRELVRRVTGEDASLTTHHVASVSDRDVLLRLQNNIKSRHRDAQRPAQALTVLEGMLLLAPDMAPLWQEAGQLQAELGNLGAASAALERCLALARSEEERRQTAALLRGIKMRLQ